MSPTHSLSPLILRREIDISAEGWGAVLFEFAFWYSVSLALAFASFLWVSCMFVVSFG
jgi:hypothetical protein